MATINLSNAANEKPGRRYQVTLSGATAQPWIILDSVNPGDAITVALIISAGEGSVKYTAEDEASMIAGTATETTWSKGEDR